MAISTKVEDRRAKTAALREKHQPIFDKLGIPDAVFIPKMAYTPYSGAQDKVISLFPSEINKGHDIFTEFVDREINSEDPQRRLWKWRFNPEFETEYEKSTPDSVTGVYRYLIPIGELIEVKSDTLENPQETLVIDIPDPDTDLPKDQMTIRDYAAIHLVIPCSNKAWLNDIIIKAKNK
jgi:hypothetical protein